MSQNAIQRAVFPARRTAMRMQKDQTEARSVTMKRVRTPPGVLMSLLLYLDVCQSWGQWIVGWKNVPADHCCHKGPCWNQRQDLEDPEDCVSLACTLVCHFVSGIRNSEQMLNERTGGNRFRVKDRRDERWDGAYGNENHASSHWAFLKLCLVSSCWTWFSASAALQSYDVVLAILAFYGMQPRSRRFQSYLPRRAGRIFRTHRLIR